LAFTLWWDELSVAEIAEAMEISTVAVWKLLTKARAVVAEGLGRP
jgi:predicted DNA-binding protein (UPF0251 family)